MTMTTSTTRQTIVLLLVSVLLASVQPALGFSGPQSARARRTTLTRVRASENEAEGSASNLGVIDLTDEDEDEAVQVVPISSQNIVVQREQVAPFLSQGEISDDPNLLSPDGTDAKQNRVIIYIILSLIPVLFLVPLMIGSRDLIPMDALPPVPLN
mmetsp:Transcript_21044/g.49401  ORF Transcript_21044/g.49401 Transcript_21044/m.49401 type:complete len:156 (+) Transcript_21044:38-505(+)